MGPALVGTLSVVTEVFLVLRYRVLLFLPVLRECTALLRAA